MAFPAYANIKKLNKLPVTHSKTKKDQIIPRLKLSNPESSFSNSISQKPGSKASCKSLVLNSAPAKSNVSSIDFETVSNPSAFELDFFQSEYNLRKYFHSNQNHFLERVSKGPPTMFRWIAWLICAETPAVREKTDYLSLLEQQIPEETQIQIEKDISRTLSEGYEFFQDEKAQNALFRLLKAVSALDECLGYCQGMNFIAGFVLAMGQFDENDCFYLFSSVLSSTFNNKFGIRAFFLPEFPLLRCYLFIFDRIFKDRLPKLHAHFKEIEIPKETWVSKWFQTLFTICLPPTVCSRLWDCVFVHGKAFMLNFAISLLKILSKRLFEIDDVVDLAEFFKKMNPYTVKNRDELVVLDGEELIQTAKNVKISQNYLDKLQNEFELEFKVKMSDFDICYNISNQNKELEFTMEEEFALFNRESDRRPSLASKDNRSDFDILKSERKSNFARALSKYVPVRSRVSKTFHEKMLFSEGNTKSVHFEVEDKVKKELRFEDESEELEDLNCEESTASQAVRSSGANTIFKK